MSRPVHRAAALVSAVLLTAALAACGDDSAPAESTPASETAKAPSPATASATSSPTTQPDGAHGVTFTVENWSRYSDNPVVEAWKKTVEAYYGSVNAREPNAEFLERTAGDQRRLWVGNINYARERDLVGAAELRGRVIRVSIRDTKAILVGCDLRETTNFRPRGKPYSGDEKGWAQVRHTFKLKGDLWVMTDSAPRGRCSKGA